MLASRDSAAEYLRRRCICQVVGLRCRGVRTKLYFLMGGVGWLGGWCDCRRLRDVKEKVKVGFVYQSIRLL